MPAGYADYVKSLLVVGNHLFLCGGNTAGTGPGHLLKIRRDDFSIRTVLTFSNDNQHHQAVDAVYSSVTDRIYVVFSNNQLVSQLLVVAEVNPNLSSNAAPAVTDEFFVNEADIMIGQGAMATDNNNLYIITWGANPSRVVKVTVPGGIVTLGPVLAGNYPCGWVIKYSNGKLYAYGTTQTSFGDTWVKRIDPVSLQTDGANSSVVLINGTDFSSMAEDMGVSTTDLWIGRRGDTSAQSIIKKVRKDTFAVSDFDVGMKGPCRIVRSANDFVWGLYDNGKAIRINPNDSTSGIYTLNDGQGFQSQINADADGFLYTAWNQSGTKIARYHIPSDVVSGGFQWVNVTTVANESSEAAIVNGVAYDPFGNAIMVGTFSGKANFGDGPVDSNPGPNPDVFLAKYTPSGSLIWKKTMGGTSISDEGVGVVTDSDGNIYITGTFTSPVEFGEVGNSHPLTSNGASDVFVAKYSPGSAGVSGVCQWAKNFGSANEDRAGGIAVDRFGDVFVGMISPGNLTVGAFPLTNLGGYDIVLFKLASATGIPIWAKIWGSASADSVSGVTVDSNGDLFVCGVTGSGNVGAGDNTVAAGGFIAKYHGNNGTYFNWTRELGAAVKPNCIAVDGAGMVYVSGSLSATTDLGNGNRAAGIFIASYNPSLAPASSYRWDNFSGSLNDAGFGIAAHTVKGRVAMAGKCNSFYTFGGEFRLNYGPFIAIFNSANGLLVWSQNNDNGSGNGKGTAVAIDAPGVFVSAGGQFSSTVKFSPTISRAAVGLNNGYLANYVL